METEHLPHGDWDCLYRQEKHVVNVIMFREVSFTYILSVRHGGRRWV